MAEQARPARILITKLKQIGDVLLATPAIGALRRRFPEARIVALVPKQGAIVLEGNPHLDGVWTYEQGGRPLVHLLREWRRFRPDWVVELGITRKERVLGVLGGGRRRAGFAAAGRAAGLTDAIAFDWSAHVVTNAERLLRSLGVEETLGPLHLSVREDEVAAVKRRLGQVGVEAQRGLAVVHPVTRWPFKSASHETMAAVIEGLRDRLGFEVALTAGPEPGESERAVRVRGLVRGSVLDLIGKLALREFAALLAATRLVVTVDGAPMHMAAALQVPQVVLFGPTGDANWGPWQAPQVCLRAPFLCRPCGKDGCLGTKVSDCLQAITAEQVLDAAQTLLGTASSGAVASV